MKLLTASAFALMMVTGIGAASACEDYYQATLEAPTAQQIAAAELRQMAMKYLEEISAEQKIA
jgi:hypothetical protein